MKESMFDTFYTNRFDLICRFAPVWSLLGILDPLPFSPSRMTVALNFLNDDFADQQTTICSNILNGRIW